MIRYKIASLPKHRRKETTATLPPIEERAGTVRDYTVTLNRLLRAMAKEVREGVLPQMQSERSLARLRARQDAPSDWFRRLEALIGELRGAASDTVNRILGLEAQRHTEEFMRTANRALGIDLSAVIRQEDIGDYLEAAALRNASLIKGLSDDAAKRIKQSVTQSVVSGGSMKELRKTLVRDFGVMGNRAKLIARDQTAKLNSDLNRIRQEQAGITDYIWRTSRDERVRERHRALEGKQYKWGEATGAEGGEPPGQPIQCRCTAEAVVVF